MNESGVVIAFTKGNITETPTSSNIEPNNIIKNSPIISHFCFVFKTYKYFFNKFNVPTSIFLYAYPHDYNSSRYFLQ